MILLVTFYQKILNLLGVVVLIIIANSDSTAHNGSNTAEENEKYSAVYLIQARLIQKFC